MKVKSLILLASLILLISACSNESECNAPTSRIKIVEQAGWYQIIEIDSVQYISNYAQGGITPLIKQVGKP